MRKWGPVVGALLVIGFIGNLFGSSEEDASSPPSPEQSTSAPGPSSETSSETSTEPDKAPQQSETPEQTETGSTQSSEDSAESAATAQPSAASGEVVQEESATSTPTPSEAQTNAPTLTPTPSSSPAPSPTASPTQPAAQPAPSADDEIVALLLSLVIEPEVTSGYDRDLFRHWIDVDGDGCDARREVLIAEAVVAPTIGDRCALVGGRWYSAFDGEHTEDPSKFDVDHMVPLKEAWDSGANEWSSDRRRAFANDLDLPQSLIAVSASSNRSKADRDPADWLPPLQSYHCQYVENWVRVKAKWELSVDEREFSAIRGVLATC